MHFRIVTSIDHPILFLRFDPVSLHSAARWPPHLKCENPPPCHLNRTNQTTMVNTHIILPCVHNVFLHNWSVDPLSCPGPYCCQFSPVSQVPHSASHFLRELLLLSAMHASGLCTLITAPRQPHVLHFPAWHSPTLRVWTRDRSLCLRHLYHPLIRYITQHRPPREMTWVTRGHISWSFHPVIALFYAFGMDSEGWRNGWRMRQGADEFRCLPPFWP